MQDDPLMQPLSRKKQNTYCISRCGGYDFFSDKLTTYETKLKTIFKKTVVKTLKPSRTEEEDENKKKVETSPANSVCRNTHTQHTTDL